jgi:hypothetical protein
MQPPIGHFPTVRIKRYILPEILTAIVSQCRVKKPANLRRSVVCANSAVAGEHRPSRGGQTSYGGYAEYQPVWTKPAHTLHSDIDAYGVNFPNTGGGGMILALNLIDAHGNAAYFRPGVNGVDVPDLWLGFRKCPAVF